MLAFFKYVLYASGFLSWSGVCLIAYHFVNGHPDRHPAALGGRERQRATPSDAALILHRGVQAQI